MGWSRNSSVPPHVPGAPEPHLRQWPAWSGAEGATEGRHRLSRAQARGAQHVRACPRRAPGCAQRSGGGRFQKLSHMPFHSPHRPILRAGPHSSPLRPRSGTCPGRTDARSGAGRRGLPAGKVSSSGAQFLHPRAGPPGAANAALSGRLCPGSPAAAAPAAATAKAGLRPVPPPRAAHTGASLAARIPALARVPEGIFLARARARAAPPARSPPRAAAAPGTRRGAARELGARAHRFRGPGPQLLPRAPVPGGCAWAHRDWVEMGDSLCNLFKTGVVTKRPLLTAF